MPGEVHTTELFFVIREQAKLFPTHHKRQVNKIGLPPSDE